MKKFIISAVAAMFLLTSPVNAEIKNITAEGFYNVGDDMNESQKASRQKAYNEALRIAIEKAGIYVESYSKSVNFKLTKNQISTIAGEIVDVKEENVKYRIESLENNVLRYIATIYVDIDTDIIAQKLEIQKKNTESIKNGNEGIENNFGDLKSDNENIEKVRQLEELYTKASNEDIDPDEKIKLALKILEIEENYRNGVGYLLQGIAYNQKKMFDKAIENDLKYTKFNPGDAYGYFCCSLDYLGLKDYENALKCINKAVEIEPNNAVYVDEKKYLDYLNSSS